MNNRQFLVVITITFIVIIIWIIADILHTRPSVEVNPKLSTLLSPINPTFDPKIIDQIKEVTPVDELPIQATSQNLSVNIPTPNRSSQPLANPNKTPVPFPSTFIPGSSASSSATPGGNP